ncbi:MAG: hypothetical protein BAJALOKI2v1_230040 [Promethearchaeota archaeon]|nr:MAG: hypothetical protein BAJALOKI2v1_230040 [Candidatus Lokiarchaeota archaeon]
MSDVGEIKILIQLFGIGVAEGTVVRHLAPLTADAILEKMPFALRGRFSFGSKKYWTLPGIGIRKGKSAKAIKDVNKNDLVYNPKTDELIVILEDTTLSNKVNKIGTVKDHLEYFLKARNGLNTKFSRK